MSKLINEQLISLIILSQILNFLLKKDNYLLLPIIQFIYVDRAGKTLEWVSMQIR